jgi:hypothetical protein
MLTPRKSQLPILGSLLCAFWLFALVLLPSRCSRLISGVQEKREIIMVTEFASSALAPIVLVHGGFVDGSGWEGVYKIQKKDGYTNSRTRLNWRR